MLELEEALQTPQPSFSTTSCSSLLHRALHLPESLGAGLSPKTN